MVKIFERLSIRTKFIASSVFTLILISAFIFISYPKQERAQAYGILEDKVSSMAEMIAISVGIALESENYTAITEMMYWVRRDKNLSYIILLDSNKELFAAYNPHFLNIDIAKFLKSGRIFEADGRLNAVVPIHYRNVGYGTLIIGYSMGEMHHEISQNMMQALFIGMAILALGIVISLVFSNLITRPIIQLRDAANEVAKGNSEVEIQINSCDEVGVLGSAFNRMIRNIQGAMEALRQSEERYRDLVENSADLICTHDLDGVILSANKTMVQVLGYTRLEEVIGKNIKDFLAPDVRQFFKLYLETIVQKGQASGLMKIRTRHGKVKILEFNNSLRTEDLEKPIIRGLGHDVTERIRTEKALAAEKEWLAVTLRSIMDGVITVDLAGRVLLMNKMAEVLTGWKQREAHGRLLDEVFQVQLTGENITVGDQVNRVLKTKASLKIREPAILISQGGKRGIVNYSVSPIQDRKERISGAVLVFQDITEKKKMEEELYRTQKLESLGILAGGIAHDFNNILTAILGNISLLKMKVRKKDSILGRLLEAEKATLRAKELTQQLLTFAKGGSPIKETASIGEIIRDTVDFALHGSPVRCIYQIPENLWPVNVDVGQISQVINNLVINAVQAMPGGGKLEVCCENITVGQEKRGNGVLLKPGRYVMISVKDEGTGIPEEYLSRIFDPFFSTKKEGNGLGLAMSYSIIRKHDGYLTVQSELGVGTIFYIYLPASDLLISRQPMRKEDIPHPGKGKILLMDDEPAVRDVGGQMLNFLGYEVAFAGDGDEAIQMYKDALRKGERFNAVIMDLTIPGGMSGREAIKKLKEIDPHINAIVSSGYSNDPVMANFEKYGFFDCVVKPYKIEELSRALMNLMVREKFRKN